MLKFKIVQASIAEMPKDVCVYVSVRCVFFSCLNVGMHVLPAMHNIASMQYTLDCF